MTSLIATNTTNVETAQAITELQIELQNSLAVANDYKEENLDLKKQLASANELEIDEASMKCRLEEGRRELKEIKLSVLNTNGGGLDDADVQSEHTSKVERLTEEVRVIYCISFLLKCNVSNTNTS